MNLSEEITAMAELHIPLGDYCFAYVDEDLTVQVNTKGNDLVALVGAFVSYMKALGFSSENIEETLYDQASTMKFFRLPDSILKAKE
jgi:hypothetical protein